MTRTANSLLHAKRMRQSATDAEAKLWRNLRAGRLAGYKFRRQQPIGRYIVDFVCFEQQLVVEVDGGQHVEAQLSDALRTEWLESEGFRVLRFWNDDVLLRTDLVLAEILRMLSTRRGQ
ncbi:endonuclease domain-containing protein [Pseudoxanthomonas sacheonensis]|uniref:Very-short-patch-repair endonuclease n=1 Tax=Pseudoxanthomonas sacheonensis TaxID=443615 RepID=A0ABU1RUE6_9GAMM|nr:endonuclease domain-containing protein [Pseudoxanthomonas sacheonensis]MDR6841744.1 very-short-patch-repair endonuclease [Pseudoxanthomonas sacheonensis]